MPHSTDGSGQNDPVSDFMWDGRKSPPISLTRLEQPIDKGGLGKGVHGYDPVQRKVKESTDYKVVGQSQSPIASMASPRCPP